MVSVPQPCVGRSACLHVDADEATDLNETETVCSDHLSTSHASRVSSTIRHCLRPVLVPRY